MNSLLKLIDCGQSYWMDNLTREKINSGELKRRVTQEGLRGVTTNPSIFNRAISKSNDYDKEIIKLFNKKKQVQEVYEELAVKDVQNACDVLRPVFDESDGIDGFVSLEVSPLLACDTERTMIEARRLHEKINRKNCFIKIPATNEGIFAIEEMLYEGININVTLIFSIKKYISVAEAYIKALERRIAEGKSIKEIRSVASFFLSRIDVLVDRLLSRLQVKEDAKNKLPNPGELYGKAAIANAKLAYMEFGKIFGSERWNVLLKHGAYVQRPLWASTGTKNKNDSDIKYVSPLIGNFTVNTLPDETIAAFADHGLIIKDSIGENLEDAVQTMNYLKIYGIDLNSATQQLLNEGIIKFQADYCDLLNNISKKRDNILSA